MAGLMQIDIFGESCLVEKLPQFQPKPKGRVRRRTMQEMHGINMSHTCRECEYLVRRRYSTKNYYKCALWSLSCSAASDILLRARACGKFEVRKGEDHEQY